MRTFREISKQFSPNRLGRDYFEGYSLHLPPDRHGVKSLMEIGVRTGRGLQVWREYFPDAKITGVDINPKCVECTVPNVSIIIGDQEDKAFLAMLAGDKYDIVIDDGGHTMRQQIRSFRALFPSVRKGGLYVIEDLHTSYWPEFGGGASSSRTTLEFLAGLVDGLHYKWWNNPRSEVVGKMPTVLEKHIASIHFYDSVCFIRKK